VNVTALDVPLAVVIATWADWDPEDGGGTVTVQEFWAGQLVAAVWPLNVATILPSELRKFAPPMAIVCPAVPLAGSMDEITGAAPGVDGTEVEVEVEVDLRVDGGDAEFGVVRPFRPPRGAGGTARACVPAAVVGGTAVWGLLPGETASAMPAATTSTATTATAATSQRSSRRSGALSGVGSTAG
jgi:hypothetical protein